MYTLEEVYTKERLIPALEKVNNEVMRQFKSLSLDDLFMRPVGKWSACDTLRHLTMAVRAVTLGLRMPKFLLRLMFGRSDKPSHKYAKVRDVYLLQLKRGAQAGKFEPSYQEIPDTQVQAEAIRRKTIKKWKKTAKAMVLSLRTWTESELDKYLLPHPILGKISAREMLFFTIYHNLHHLQTVQHRVREMQSQSED